MNTADDDDGLGTDNGQTGFDRLIEDSVDDNDHMNEDHGDFSNLDPPPALQPATVPSIQITSPPIQIDTNNVGT